MRFCDSFARNKKSAAEYCMAAVLREEQKRLLTLKFGSAKNEAHDLENFGVAGWVQQPCLTAGAGTLPAAAHRWHHCGIIHVVGGLDLGQRLFDLLL